MSDYTFICYAHEDIKFSLKLSRVLKNRGVQVWLDQWHTPADELFDNSVSKAVRGCTHFLVVLSPAAVNSWVVRDQTLLALHEGKQIVPVLHKDCQIPAVLGDTQPVDFSDKPFGQAMGRLFAAITGQPIEDTSDVGMSKIIQLWNTARRRVLFWPVIIALVLLVGVAATFSFWPTEATIVPQRFEPVTGGKPVVIPTFVDKPAPNVQPTPINSQVRKIDGQTMVFIPAGDFLMGSNNTDPNAEEDEMPQHLVFLDAYWIDQTEITNAQYQQCVTAGACLGAQVGPRFFKEPQLPAVGVNWEQAKDYCRWVGARLPSEAEWEKAARGVDGRLYPWGNEFDDTRLNYCDSNCVADWRDFEGDDGYKYTAPVGSYPLGASPFGVLDMSGNVWEWTADWYAADAYQTAPYKNPQGPTEGLQRVIRGGSWLYNGRALRLPRRNRDVPTSSYENIGFRCVVSVED